jgi:putative pyruvate formate lyase activating enzyme
MVRHLVLPHGIAGSRESLTWLVNEVSPGVSVGIMAQYQPAHRAYRYKELDRRLFPAEYQEVVGLVEELGIENGWIQDLDSPGHYLPDFSVKEPFSKKRRRRRR